MQLECKKVCASEKLIDVDCCNCSKKGVNFALYFNLINHETGQAKR